MALVNVILLVELALMVCSARNIFKALTLANLYCILYDFYSAYRQKGTFIAILFVCLVNFTYLLAVCKLL